MLEGFEEVTKDLTEEELKSFPLIRSLLIRYLTDVEKPIKQPELCTLIDITLKESPYKIKKLTGVRLRKYVSKLRMEGDLPIIATSEGYFISHNSEHIENEILSLEQRAAQIIRAADGMRKFLKHKR